MNSEITSLLIKTNKLDLSKIRARVSRENAWSDTHTSAVEKQYRMFFSLMGSSLGEHMSPPTHDIDLFWHAHILHTMNYDNDCRRVHGKFLHHVPLDSSNEEMVGDNDSMKTFCDIFDTEPFSDELSAIQCVKCKRDCSTKNCCNSHGRI